MMVVLLLVICSFITIEGFVISKSFSSRRHQFNIYRIFCILYTIVHGPMVFFVYLLTVLGFNSEAYTSVILNYTFSDMILYFLAASLFICFFYLGYRVKIKKFKFKCNVNLYRTLYITSIICFVIGFVCYYLYTRAYGGFAGIFKYTIAIRSSFTNISNPFSFFQKFSQLCRISSYIIFTLAISKSTPFKIKKRSIFLFPVFFVFTIYSYLSQGTRTGVGMLFITIILIYGFYNSKNMKFILKKIYKPLLIIPFIILFVDNFWKRSGGSSFLELMVQAFSPTLNAFKIILNLHNYQFFKNIIFSPVFLLPYSIWNKFGFISGNAVITYLQNGAFKGTSVGGHLITGDSLTSLLAYSYTQLNFIGVIICGILCGMLIKLINNLLNKYEENNTFRSFLLGYICITVLYTIVFNGDIQGVVTNHFGTLIFYLVYLIVKKFTKKRVI